MSEVLVIWIGINLLCLFVMFICYVEESGTYLSFVNPVVIYKHIPVNWFGAILFSIVLHIVFPIIAVIYWFYKLITVGRKDD